MRTKNLHKSCLVLLALLVIVGCTNPSVLETPATTAITMTAKVQITQVIAPTSFKTPKVEKSTVTITPSTTPVPMSTTSFTPIPTLSPERSKEVFLQISNTNGGCDFPCLWGITPEKTKIDALHQFEYQFGNVENPKDFSTSLLWGNDNSDLYFQIVKNTLGETFDFMHKGSPGIDYLLLEVNIAHKLGLNKFLKSDYYEMPMILSRYGDPTQVLLGPWPDDPDRPQQWLPFDIDLFYQNQGFFIEYVLERQKDAVFFVGCPDQIVGLRVITWDPNQSRSIDDIVGQKTDFYGIDKANINSFFLSSEDSININVHNFYEMYKGQKNQPCIKAPRIKWSYGYMKTLTP
ncbi:MAG: hypothetical protein P4L50_07640 [Anaerolineaceae bacterium]|nr:hypothetical protein [Anaerolineaceae bacterium]